MLRLHPARLPRLLRSLAMTNLGVPSSRVIARRAQARRGNLGKAVANSPEAFPCSGRCCEIATAPAEPRNDKLGGLSHPEGRSDKLGSPLQGPLGSRRNFFSFPLTHSVI